LAEGAVGTAAKTANSSFALRVGLTNRSALKYIGRGRCTTLAEGTVGTAAKTANSSFALRVGLTNRSALKYIGKRFPTASTFGAVRACTIGVRSICTLLVNYALKSTRKLVIRPRPTLSSGTVGTAANALNSTLALLVSIAVRSALILVINLGAFGASKSGRLEITHGVVFAVKVSANERNSWGKEAIVAAVRRAVCGEWGKQHALDDVDHAIIGHLNILLPKFNVRVLTPGIVQLGDPFGLLLHLNFEAFTIGDKGSLFTQILNGHLATSGMIGEDADQQVLEWAQSRQ